MKTKLLILAGVLIIILIGAFIYKEQKKPEEKPAFETTTNQPSEQATTTNETIPLTTTSPGKLKVINFTGTLQEVNTGCFADGECYVVVDGKHITTFMGWSKAEVGSVIGAEDGFGSLEKHIGEKVEVYAKDNGDGTYTLYGSGGFYVKVN